MEVYVLGNDQHELLMTESDRDDNGESLSEAHTLRLEGGILHYRMTLEGDYSYSPEILCGSVAQARAALRRRVEANLEENRMLELFAARLGPDVAFVDDTDYDSLPPADADGDEGDDD